MISDSEVKQMKVSVLLLSLLIMVALLNIASGTNINWTKYLFEDSSDGFPCASTEYLFVRNDVLDSFACSKLCFLQSKCLTAVFRLEEIQCIGCSSFSYQGLPNQGGSIQLSRRDFYIDCKDVLAKDKFAKSGIYEIRLKSTETIKVYCSMATEGGGWTVFQNRFNGSVDFNRSFTSYENGFGELNGEFWLGLRFLKDLTDQPSEFMFEFETSIKGSTGNEKYKSFKLLGEKYVLSIIDPMGEGQTKLNSFVEFNSSEFAAYDMTAGHGCAELVGGGWWFHKPPVTCHPAILNGEGWRFFHKEDWDGDLSLTSGVYLTRATLMVRRR